MPRILIADDDRVTTRRLQSLITAWGYESVVTSDGPAALAALSGPDAPRVAVLDWMMPELDGLEVCRQLRAGSAGESVYVILLTSRTGSVDLIAGLEAGADEYLVKPFNTDELRARLKAGVRIAELQRRLSTNIAELTDALGKVRQLSGLLPICSYCKSIRDDSNYWHAVDEYVTEHADVQFSHGICPKCYAAETKRLGLESDSDT